jgi:hypothetical protein
MVQPPEDTSKLTGAAGGDRGGSGEAGGLGGRAGGVGVSGGDGGDCTAQIIHPAIFTVSSAVHSMPKEAVAVTPSGPKDPQYLLVFGAPTTCSSMKSYWQVGLASTEKVLTWRSVSSEKAKTQFMRSP